ncbi:GlsB/YeaQ/YmgE family stress response membrane protein [Granulicella paludicola]|uniref:GlsB/YeaQ/YmgE family stress response membrane protein n=1 Tax=Granulicella paludicola TaxID=474951 RepID=UPI0021E00D06|nr:GlsB/YeaQ/YmgE family stress response membrane protein [Granulicella paludicola]
MIWWILVGLIAGFLTGKIMKGSGFGVIGDIVIGILGALIGGWIAGKLGFAASGGLLYSILIATLGAILLTFLFRLVTGRE